MRTKELSAEALEKLRPVEKRIKGDMMELKAFLGQVVRSASTNKRYILEKITASEIGVASAKPGTFGYPEHYVYRTINGDPISTGALVFEKPELTEPFQAAFATFAQTEAARWEEYGYWMRRE